MDRSFISVTDSLSLYIIEIESIIFISITKGLNTRLVIKFTLHYRGMNTIDACVMTEYWHRHMFLCLRHNAINIAVFVGSSDLYLEDEDEEFGKLNGKHEYIVRITCFHMYFLYATP